MDAQYLDLPPVRKMIWLAIRRMRRLFDAFPDIDDESLFADAWGELVRANYNPAKSQPHTFAYQVAWRRLRDISRRRELELKRQNEGREMGEFRRQDNRPQMTVEESAVELYETVCRRFEEMSMELRPKNCGKVYSNRAQRVALHLLCLRYGWSCRQATKELGRRAEVVSALGLRSVPSRMAFCRMSGAVTQLSASPPARIPA